MHTCTPRFRYITCNSQRLKQRKYLLIDRHNLIHIHNKICATIWNIKHTLNEKSQTQQDKRRIISLFKTGSQKEQWLPESKETGKTEIRIRGGWGN